MSPLATRTPLGTGWLGRRGYRELLTVQRRLVELRQAGAVGDLLLLLEHEPVYTLGRRTEPGDLLHDRSFYEARGIAVEETPRGGKVTYHGPGQLVAYPIVDLGGIASRPGETRGVGVPWFVEALEGAMIRTLRRWGVGAGRITGLTGLWVDGHGPPAAGATAASAATGVASGRIRKIGSIGLKISRGVTSHGLALNVSDDLAPFGWINSCGIEHCTVTSLESEQLGAGMAATVAGRTGASPPRAATPDPEAVGIALAEELAEILDRRLEPLDPALCEPGGAGPGPAPPPAAGKA